MTVCPRHESSCGVPIVLEVPTLHGIALKTLTTKDPREVKVKVKGRAKGSQVGGIEDPGGRSTSRPQWGKGDKGAKGEKGQVTSYGKGKGSPSQSAGANRMLSNYAFYNCPVNLFAM